MKIQDLFLADVTRDIPPVVYFHEQDPAKLRDEVAEYIITGGYPEGDPRARRLKAGIHEQFVHLLRALTKELNANAGLGHPASWISGFYGSGKSSFAKLLGLSLDGAKLPDGSLLVDALLARDDSPRRQEFVDAWRALRAKIDPIAVVFDIGGVARDDEHVHVAALRQVQARLGYCTRSAYVAAHELKLERDGHWEQFLATAEKTLNKPWSRALHDQLADDHFSHVLHVMDPERYQNPMSWLDSRAGAKTGEGTSVREVAADIEAMLDRRVPGKSLFIVVDEVSQYIHQDEDRMVKLQTFVSELGQRLKGRVWLFATGQQKLEDAGEAQGIGKLKDRFPSQLRVHLHPSNIRDVVHKRLLAKRGDREQALRDLFQKHRAELQLYAYGCAEVTEEDFVEVYPMLPSQVDLLMKITSNLRTRSSRVQGDDHAIRGLLQLLGELFREQELGDREVGELVTLDAIFEVQQTALEPDVQATLGRILDHPEVREDVLALRAARAVALLEQIQEQDPTTVELVAKCLYAKLGEGNRVQAVAQALEKLRAQNLLGYSEKHGFKIQSSAGQEWEKERDEIGIPSEQISEVVRDKLKELLAAPERPRYKGNSFPWAAYFSDGHHLSDDRMQGASDNAPVTVDFRFLKSRDARADAIWVQRSGQEPINDRLLWVVGDPGEIEGLARSYARSAHMVKRHAARRQTLSMEKGRLLLEEEAHKEDLDRRLGAAVQEAFLDGKLFFRGLTLEPRTLGSAFATALVAAAQRILPDLYPHFTEIAITESELAQLFERTLSGPSTKFMEQGLGLLSLDEGRYVPSCTGVQPRRVLEFVEKQQGASGSTILIHFGSPPYGYAPDLVRACLVGLLRGSKIRIRPEGEKELTSISDPGTRDLFRKDRSLRLADVFPAKEGEITQRDLIAIRSFFKKSLDIDLQPDKDTFRETAFAQFPGRRDQLRGVEERYNRLPGRPPLPDALARLGKALEDCVRSPRVEEAVIALKRNLPALQDGLEQLGMLRTELTDEAIEQVQAAHRALSVELEQLRQVEGLAGLEAEEKQLEAQLASARPWRGVGTVAPAVAKLRERYVEHRKGLLGRQNGEAEAARSRLKSRQGFDKLSADQAHQVLRPFTTALFDTTADAVAPALSEMRAGFPQRLAAADDAANEKLDAYLAELNEAQVVKVEASLRGREIKSRAELKQLFQELEERIGPHLDKGSRIRIV